MRKILTTLLFVINVMSSYAHDVEIEGIYYFLVPKAKEAFVTYKGEDYYNKDYYGSVIIPSTINYNGVTYSVTRISVDAFHNCSGLTSITIPNTVTSIGSDAFYHCM